jgi:hypothetical protein
MKLHQHLSDHGPYGDVGSTLYEDLLPAVTKRK